MAIYYVDPLNGDDLADGLTFANAFASTQKAADTAAVAGDEVRLCASATETPTATIDFNTNLGPVVFVAYEADGSAPLGAGEFYTISGASIPLAGDVMDFNLAGINCVLLRARVTSGPGVGVDLNGNCTVEFSNGRIDNHASHGVLGDNSTSRFVGFSTEVDHNGGKGITQTTTTRFQLYLDGCRIHDNLGNGVDTGAMSSIINCRVYANTGVGIKCDAITQVVDCVAFNNTGNGLTVGTTGGGSLYHNNTLASNGGYGLSMPSMPLGRAIDWNHYHNNTSGETDQSSTPGDVNQTGDPLFANTTAGSEDFTPQTGSPLIGNGIGGSTIGAVSHADGGGGTTVIVIED